MTPQWRFIRGLLNNRIAHLYEFKLQPASVVTVHDDTSYEDGEMLTKIRCDARMPIYMESRAVTDWRTVEVVCDACIILGRH